MAASQIEKEKNIVGSMIRMFCSMKHRSKDLCLDCRELLDYAKKRLNSCLFQDEKTACSKCKVHCYSPQMRKKIVTVMRFAGPRMIFKNPAALINHVLKSFNNTAGKK